MHPIRLYGLALLVGILVCCTPQGDVLQTKQRLPDGWTGTITPPPARSIRLFFGGDVMQHKPQLHAAYNGREFDYEPVFRSLTPLINEADWAIVNLETTLTRQGPYTGYPLFRSPVVLADALQQAGVNVVVLANNHCCDGGAAGIRTTVEELDRCGIRHTGVFVDSASYRLNHPLYLNRDGVRFALVNYTYGTNGMPVPEGMLVNRIDTVAMAKDLAAVHKREIDFIVAYLHWGDEYQLQENENQRRLADFLHRHGVDLIIGSHPHVIQPWKADSTHVRLYSLGNLISAQRKRHTDGGLVASIDVQCQSDGRNNYRLCTTPVWVHTPGYTLITPETADTLSLPATYQTFIRDYEQLKATP